MFQNAKDMISKIKFKNFKLFKDWQTLEIKPITILIGKNNTGKTAVLKLPTMLGESLKGKINEALKLESGGVKIGSEYRDLVYNRRIFPGEYLRFEISNSEEDSTFGLLKVAVKLPTNMIKDKSEIEEWAYFENDKVLFTKEEESLFQGFVRENNVIEDIQLNYDYIEALRVKPEEEYTFKNEEFTKIGLRGENAYSILINDYNNEKEICNAVSSWYKSNFENWSFEIQDHQIPGSSNLKYRFTLKNNNIEPVNIVNTGQGITQVLPLITRSFMKEIEPTLIIIEEPESHLHPAAHGNLAQRFVESFLEDNNKRYLVETHSENFILRLQNLIADPDFHFTPDDLQIYYVDYDENNQISTLKPIVIEEDGEIEDWPDNVFNESIDEVYKLRRNQKKRKTDASKN